MRGLTLPNNEGKEGLILLVEKEIRNKQKIELSEIWLDECIDYLSAHGPWTVDPPLLANYVFNLFLSMDLRLSAKRRIIPDNIMVLHKEVIFKDQLVVLQIDEVVNVASSKQQQKNQYLNQQTAGSKKTIEIIPTDPENESAAESIGNIGKVNKLLLTDGFTEVVALDIGQVLLQAIKRISGNHKNPSNFIGAKVALKNVLVRRGALLLTASSAMILGGEVPSLAAQRERALAANGIELPPKQNNSLASSTTISSSAIGANAAITSTSLVTATAGPLPSLNNHSHAITTTEINYSTKQMPPPVTRYQLPPTHAHPPLTSTHTNSHSSLEKTTLLSPRQKPAAFETIVIMDSDDQKDHFNTSQQSISLSNDSVMSATVKALVTSVPTPTVVNHREEEEIEMTDLIIPKRPIDDSIAINASMEEEDPFGFQFDYYDAPEPYGNAWDQEQPPIYQSISDSKMSEQPPKHLVQSPHVEYEENVQEEEEESAVVNSNYSLATSRFSNFRRSAFLDSDNEEEEEHAMTSNQHHQIKKERIDQLLPITKMEVEPPDEFIPVDKKIPLCPTTTATHSFQWRALSPSLLDPVQTSSSSATTWIVRGLARRLYRFHHAFTPTGEHQFEVIIEFDDGNMTIPALIDSQICVDYFHQYYRSILQQLSPLSPATSRKENLPQLMKALKHFQGIFSYRVVSSEEQQSMKTPANIRLLQQMNDPDSMRNICELLFEQL